MKISVVGDFRYNEEKEVIGFKAFKEYKHIIKKLIDYKKRRENFEQTTLYPKMIIDIPANDRTLNQNDTIWALNRILFISQNGEEPTEAEAYRLYIDMLDLYADKIPNSLEPSRLRAVHLPESNTIQAAKIIEGYIFEISEHCNLNFELQMQVKDIFDEWIAWRGEMEYDPLDYFNFDKKILLTEEQWRERNKISAASGKMGTQFDPIVKAHIVSNGASGLNTPWDWIPLLASEHNLQHKIGWPEFIKMYKSLSGRVVRARRMAGKIER